MKDQEHSITSRQCRGWALILKCPLKVEQTEAGQTRLLEQIAFQKLAFQHR